MPSAAQQQRYRWPASRSSDPQRRARKTLAVVIRPSTVVCQCPSSVREPTVEDRVEEFGGYGVPDGEVGGDPDRRGELAEGPTPVRRWGR